MNCAGLGSEYRDDGCWCMYDGGGGARWAGDASRCDGGTTTFSPPLAPPLLLPLPLMFMLPLPLPLPRPAALWLLALPPLALAALALLLGALLAEGRVDGGGGDWYCCWRCCWAFSP